MGIFNEEIDRCINIFEKGGLVLYPTYATWAIGCDATDEQAISKVLDLNTALDNEPLTSLVASQAMLERYVTSLPEVAYDILDFSEKSVTLILDNPKGIAANLINNNTAPFSVARTKFCQYLINKYKKPLVAKSISIRTPTTHKKFQPIPSQISQSVDYVVNLQPEKENTSLSSIIKLGNDGTVKVIRE